MRVMGTARRSLVVFAAVSTVAAATCNGDEPTTESTTAVTSVETATSTTTSTIATTTSTTDTASTTTTTTTTTPVVVTSTGPESTTTISCTPLLRRGCVSDAVRTLQVLLADAGFGDIATDGIFGAQTEAALIAFESVCSVCTADGLIEIDGPEWIELEATEPEVGYAAAFSSFIGGGLQDSCRDFGNGNFPEPTFGFGAELQNPDEAARLLLGYDYDICFLDFDVDQDIELTVDGPNGVRTITIKQSFSPVGGVRSVFAPDGPTEIVVDDAFASLRERLDDPSLPGEYRLTAVQGDTTVVRTVDLVTGEQVRAERRMIPIDDGDWFGARSGDPLRMVLIGFPASSEVPLAVYRLTATDEFDESGEFEFVTPLDPATVGSQGWGYHDFVLPVLDPDDATFPDYCIATIPELREPTCRPWDPSVNVVG